MSCIGVFSSFFTKSPQSIFTSNLDSEEKYPGGHKIMCHLLRLMFLTINVTMIKFSGRFSSFEVPTKIMICSYPL